MRATGDTHANGEVDVPNDDNGEDDEPCHRCGVTWWEPDNEMLLCDGDGCEKAFHKHCLPRPLVSVPEGDWLCPACDPDTAQLQVSQLSIPLEEARRLIRQNRKALARPAARAAGSSRPLPALEAAEVVSESEGEEGAPCEACHRVVCSATNEMLLCDGDGCEKAFHMLCLPRPLASVPEGDWLCPSCEAGASAPRWGRAQELAMQLEGADRLCWALDRHGLWGKARVLGVQGHGERRTARVSFSGFAKKYDEDIAVGDGRLRTFEAGPHDAGSEPLRSDAAMPGCDVYLVDRVLEARCMRRSMRRSMRCRMRRGVRRSMRRSPPRPSVVP